MEPIELNGKTFCSNCGLAVGVTPPSSPSAPITSFPQSQFGDTVIPRTEVATPIEVPSTPLKDETKRELGMDVDGPNDLIPSESPAPNLVKLTVASEESTIGLLQTSTTQPTKEPDNVEQLLSEISGTNIPTSSPVEGEVQIPVEIDTPADQVTRIADTPSDEPDIWSGGNTESKTEATEVTENTDEHELLPVNLPTDAETIPPLARDVEVPDESDFEVIPISDNHQNEINQAKIKEVDTLGASGILLDILGDEIDQNETEKEIASFEAAENLVDDLTFEPSDDLAPKEDEAETIPDDKLDKTPLSDILRDEPQNPVEYPEITSPLDEPELEAGDDTVEEAAVVDHDTNPVTESEPEDELYTLPHELEKKKLNARPEKVADIPEKDEKEIEAIEKTITEAKIPEISVDEDQAEEIDPDTIPASAIKKPDKQAILAEYFRTKMTDGKPAKKFKLAKTPKTPMKPKKPFTFGAWLLPAIIGGILFVLLAGGGLAYFLFSKTPAKVTHITPTGIGFEPQLPTTIVENYILSDSSSNDVEHTFRAKYTLTDDSSKTIVYTQAQPSDPDSYITKFTNGDGVVLTQKTIGDIEYTDVNDKTLLWTKSGFVYTIETTNYNKSVDLLYQMAQSVS